MNSFTWMVRLACSEYVVEATTFAEQALWASFVDRTKRVSTWAQLGGFMIPVYEHAPGWETKIDARWVRVDGRLVLFWNPAGTLISVPHIKCYLKRHTAPNLSTNDWNFHNVVRHIHGEASQ